MKLLMLAKSSLKKNISSTLTLFFLIIIATIFLYIGLIIFFNLDGFLDQKNETVNGADYVAVVPHLYKSNVEAVLSKMDGVHQLEQEAIVVYNSADIKNTRVEAKTQSIGLIFQNTENDRTISKLKVIGNKGEMKENSIVVPYCLKSSNGYKIGDTIEITYMGETASYILYGFSEDVMFSTPTNINIYKCFVPEIRFKELYSNASSSSKSVFFKADLKEDISTESFGNRFVKLISHDQSFDSSIVMGLNYETMKIGTKMSINIIMFILIFFAALVLIISMVVIRYTVITHIEEDIKNIGSMAAAGYTSGIIRSALILQFLLIAGVGYLAGILLSLICSGVITGIIASSIGLNWQTDVSPVSMIITLAIILLLLFVIIWKVTHRIRKITPLMALRSGIDTFHFGRNYFPLETTHANINLILGFKQIFNNKKQSISIVIIGILMSFTMLFSFVMYYSFVLKDSAFWNLIGMEKSDIAVFCFKDNQKAFQIASEQEGIKKAIHYTQSNITLIKDENEVSSPVYISNDFNSLEINTVIDGRYPNHDNEIVLSTLIQDKLKAEIGDVIFIKVGTAQFNYIVVGITQHINHLGQSVSITEEGMKRSNPSFIANALYLYVDNSEAKQRIIDQLSDKLIGYDATVTDMDDVFTTMISTVSQTMILICVIIDIITTIIIALILYYLVKVKILRDKINLGVQKALGFTTGQLILHNNINLITVIFVSTLIGSLLAAILINPLSTLLLSMSGLRSCSFSIPFILVLITLGIMTFLTFVTTTLVSLRIRRLNPRELIAE